MIVPKLAMNKLVTSVDHLTTVLLVVIAGLVRNLWNRFRNKQSWRGLEIVMFMKVIFEISINAVVYIIP